MKVYELETTKLDVKFIHVSQVYIKKIVKQMYLFDEFLIFVSD